ncbi:tripartite tricarboxylate transporter TctB family protein [Phyllobacterium phragmitis]|nr:tripartite tricarboxylate transporter TctB family protein [Phyllobacterium phragmitis]
MLLGKIDRRQCTDLILALCVVIGASLLLYGASSLPAPRFEPLGSAALPRGLAVLLIVFAAIIAVRALLRVGADTADEFDEIAREEAAASGVSLWRGWAMFITLVTYVAALDFAEVPFVAATTLMLVVNGFVLSAFSVRSIVTFGAVGIILSLSLSFVFFNFLHVDLG